MPKRLGLGLPALPQLELEIWKRRIRPRISKKDPLSHKPKKRAIRKLETTHPAPTKLSFSGRKGPPTDFCPASLPWILNSPWSFHLKRKGLCTLTSFSPQSFLPCRVLVQSQTRRGNPQPIPPPVAIPHKFPILEGPEAPPAVAATPAEKAKPSSNQREQQRKPSLQGTLASGSFMFVSCQFILLSRLSRLRLPIYTSTHLKTRT